MFLILWEIKIKNDFFINQFYLMYSKLSKKELINDITIFFLKQGLVCEGNIHKISKNKLIQIMIENDIPHINNELLKEEIEETEKYNYYIQIIYHNFMKYKKPSIDIIKSINTFHKSKDLEIIIKNNNLKFDNDINEIKELVSVISDAIDKYKSKIGFKENLNYKTIPDIINYLSLIQ